MLKPGWFWVPLDRHYSPALTSVLFPPLQVGRPLSFTPEAALRLGSAPLRARYSGGAAAFMGVSSQGAVGKYSVRRLCELVLPI